MASLFKTPSMPKPPPEVAMPDPEDVRARMAKQKVMQDALTRQGRDSTILNQGADYSRSTLGSGNPK